MTRRTEKVQHVDVPEVQEADADSATVSFGYRGEQFEAELDVAQQRLLDSVMQRYAAAGRVTG